MLRVDMISTLRNLGENSTHKDVVALFQSWQTSHLYSHEHKHHQNLRYDPKPIVMASNMVASKD